MEVQFRKSFEKDLGKLRDVELLARIKTAIVEVESARKLEALNNIKKLKAKGNYLSGAEN